MSEEQQDPFGFSAEPPPTERADQPPPPAPASTGIAWGAILLLLAIALVVILAVQKADGLAGQMSVWAAILAIHVVLWLTMRYSLLIIRVIKDGGVVLVTRLAGMMLSAIAVQQIINGVTQVVQGS